MKRFASALLLFIICTLVFGQNLPANDPASKARAVEKFENFMNSDEWPVPEGLAADQECEGFCLKVNGQLRKALAVYPKSAKEGVPAPLLFVFHGRRGLIPGVMKNMSIYKDMPEAIVVYPQGLWVDTPNAQKLQWGSGWKMPTAKGDWRDIHFFDSLLDTICKSFSVDRKRIYSMGHSNGGGMTYGLWSVRGDIFAAVSISCTSSRTSGDLPDKRGPKPVFFVIATQDQLVDYEKYRTYIDFVVARQTDGIPVPLGPGKSFYKGTAAGADVIVDVRETSHKIDREAMPMIADFFRSHTL